MFENDFYALKIVQCAPGPGAVVSYIYVCKGYNFIVPAVLLQLVVDGLMECAMLSRYIKAKEIWYSLCAKNKWSDRN